MKQINSLADATLYMLETIKKNEFPASTFLKDRIASNRKISEAFQAVTPEILPEIKIECDALMLTIDVISQCPLCQVCTSPKIRICPKHQLELLNQLTNN